MYPDFVWTKSMDYALQAAMRGEGLRLLADLRHEVGNAFVALELWLLRPMCWHCESSLWGVEEDDPLRPSSLVPVFQSRKESILCVYDRANQHVRFVIDEKKQEPYELACWRCGQNLEAYDGSKMAAYPESFGEYFQLPESGPSDPPTTFKRSLKAIYANKCVACGEEFKEADLTVDHIVARADGGDGAPLNLQVLCQSCNAKKANRPVKSVELYLDMLLVPYPD